MGGVEEEEQRATPVKEKILRWEGVMRNREGSQVGVAKKAGRVVRKKAEITPWKMKGGKNTGTGTGLMTT